MKRTLALALFTTACLPSSERPPEPGSVTITLGASPTLTVAHPIRIAVVWVTQEGRELPSFVVTEDRRVRSERIALTLVAPSPATVRDLAPIESIDFNGGATSLGRMVLRTSAYRPRFVVYEDVDEDQRLAPSSIEGDGPDRILGADSSFSPIVAYLPNLDLVLEELTTEQFALYEASTDGRYTAFVAARGMLDSLFVSPREDGSIFLDDGDIGEASVRCLHRLFGATTPPIDVDFTVNDELDPLVVCGTTAGACRSRDLDDVVPPPFLDDEDELLPGVTCRRNEQLEVLGVSSTRAECEGCQCVSQRSAVAFATTTTSTPTWWPCGDVVPYCRGGALLAFDAGCTTD